MAYTAAEDHKHTERCLTPAQKETFTRLITERLMSAVDEVITIAYHQGVIDARRQINEELEESNAQLRKANGST